MHGRGRRLADVQRARHSRDALELAEERPPERQVPVRRPGFQRRSSPERRRRSEGEWPISDELRAPKKELVHRHSSPSTRDLSSAVFEYIEALYNRSRRHSTLGYLSPEEFERGRITTRYND